MYLFRSAELFSKIEADKSRKQLTKRKLKRKISLRATEVTVKYDDDLASQRYRFPFFFFFFFLYFRFSRIKFILNAVIVFL